MNEKKIYYHLPGLFEFYDFYKVFLPIYKNHREFFYEWCSIGSIYGNPCDCIWSGGRISDSNISAYKVLELMNEYEISPRLTFSNCLLEEKHLSDQLCNQLCQLFSQYDNSGIIVCSNRLLQYLQKHYPNLYFISSTTKVLTKFEDFKQELNRSEFRYVVPDFRLNKSFALLASLSSQQKDKVEFLCNECCIPACNERKACYENVSRMILYEDVDEHVCKQASKKKGYRFSLAMENPYFISVNDICKIYIPLGFTNFKIEGRSLGTALILEMLLYYMVKPQYQIHVRELMYLDNLLDLF